MTDRRSELRRAVAVAGRQPDDRQQIYIDKELSAQTTVAGFRDHRSMERGPRLQPFLKLDKMTKPADILPRSLPPRGLSRVQSAAYIGVGPTKFDEMVADGPTKFDEMVADGRMPKPRRIDGRVVWDRLELDEAFAALPSEADSNPWDEGVT